MRYLFSPKALTPYRIMAALFVFLGSAVKLDLVWELSDFFTGIIVIPNLIGLLALSGVAVKVLKDYDAKIPFNAADYKRAD